ncbi:TetR/AcrR family transcriptional regulator [Pseudoroseicyclus tamaricis]|uniref:TetR family transcriptional regulator n=1 Tax=Pseudoroseicyclus tamaricis TaxID=2705421 RepID=A0A6B2JV29_9RHOB|nr:TetR/AcrR family transcriptional regulator [Pseudoroseicyclus tamaricis]NDV01930.1 TetR family transcriptional regulator [Pseudoroseicyclus tamaricis]
MEAIQHAALTLAEKAGFEQVTTEMIAAEAGISPRTFFNYFPFKEAAFIPARIVLPEEDRRRFCEARGTVAEDLLQLMEAARPNLPQNREMLRMCKLIASENSRLMAMNFDFLREVEEQLTQLFHARGGHVGGARASLMAALTTAAIRNAFERWIDGEGETPEEMTAANIAVLAPIFEGSAEELAAAE